MKIEFKTKIKVCQICDVMNVLNLIGEYCSKAGKDDLNYLSWLLNVKNLYDYLHKKKIQSIGKQKTDFINIKMNLLQYKLFRDSLIETNMEIQFDEFYNSLIRSLIQEPFEKQFEQFKILMR